MVPKRPQLAPFCVLLPQTDDWEVQDTVLLSRTDIAFLQVEGLGTPSSSTIFRWAQRVAVSIR